jgi:8-oxo-dGTP pyrophosphatase MutT (NUDIX family)
MLSQIKNELNKVKNKVESKIYKQFIDRLNLPGPYTKSEYEPNHLCAFFVPYHQNSNSILLAEHKKAKDWIPPGGHIEPGEHPIDTVKREFKEELGTNLTNETINIFNLSIKPIPHRLGYCKTHFDMWYLVNMNSKINFIWDRREFSNAGWYSLEKGAQKIKFNDDYKKIVLDINNFLV